MSYRINTDANCGVCSICVNICPVGAIDNNGVRKYITERCINCGACETQCPAGYIESGDE